MSKKRIDQILVYYNLNPKLTLKDKKILNFQKTYIMPEGWYHSGFGRKVRKRLDKNSLALKYDYIDPHRFYGPVVKNREKLVKIIKTSFNKLIKENFVTDFDIVKGQFSESDKINYKSLSETKFFRSKKKSRKSVKRKSRKSKRKSSKRKSRKSSKRKSRKSVKRKSSKRKSRKFI